MVHNQHGSAENININSECTAETQYVHSASLSLMPHSGSVTMVHDGCSRWNLTIKNPQPIWRENKGRELLMITQSCKYHSRRTCWKLEAQRAKVQKRSPYLSLSWHQKIKCCLELNSVLSLDKRGLLRYFWRGGYFVQRGQPVPSWHEWRWKLVENGWSEKGVEAWSQRTTLRSFVLSDGMGDISNMVQTS